MQPQNLLTRATSCPDNAEQPLTILHPLKQTSFRIVQKKSKNNIEIFDWLVNIFTQNPRLIKTVLEIFIIK